MRKIFLMNVLVFLAIPQVVLGEEIVMFPIPPQSNVIMSEIVASKPKGSPSIKLFGETDEHAYVCVNAVLPVTGKCGSTSVKECYPSAGKPTIHVVGGKDYDRLNGSAMETNDFYFSMTIKDETNNKRCQVSITGTRTEDGEAYPCRSLTLRCF